MDEELKAYFDERFREASQVITQQVYQLLEPRFEQIEARFEEVNARFEEVNARFEEVNARFEEVNARFEEVNARFGEVDRQLREARETARQTLVLVEDLRHKMELIAEGYGSLDNRLARLESDREQYARSVHMDDPVKDLDKRVTILETWVDRHSHTVGESIRRLTAGPSAGVLPSK